MRYETRKIDMSMHEIVVAGHIQDFLEEGYEFVGQIGIYAIWRRPILEPRAER